MNSKREEIIQLVTPLFLKLGFKDFSVDQIAKELSISKKTLYKYFSNKEELILGVSDYLTEFFLSMFDELAKSDMPTFEICVFFVDYVQSNFGLLQQGENLRQIQKYYPEAADKMMEVYERIIFLLYMKAALRLKEEGYVDTDINLEANGFVFTRSFINLHVYTDFSNLDYKKHFYQWYYIFVKVFLNEKGIDAFKSNY